MTDKQLLPGSLTRLAAEDTVQARPDHGCTVLEGVAAAAAVEHLLSLHRARRRPSGKSEDDEPSQHPVESPDWLGGEGAQVALSCAGSIGRLRTRLPVAAKIALHSAGAIGGTPGSPMPVGGASPSTM
jgi:hypothetical protein